jgi:hypothetical protein
MSTLKNFTKSSTKLNTKILLETNFFLITNFLNESSRMGEKQDKKLFFSKRKLSILSKLSLKSLETPLKTKFLDEIKKKKKILFKKIKKKKNFYFHF